MEILGIDRVEENVYFILKYNLYIEKPPFLKNNNTGLEEYLNPMTPLGSEPKILEA